MKWTSRVKGVWKAIVKAVTKPFRRQHAPAQVAAPAKQTTTAAPAKQTTIAAQEQPISEFAQFKARVKSYANQNELGEGLLSYMKDPVGFKGLMEERRKTVPSFSLDDLIDEGLKIPQAYRIMLMAGNDYQNEDGSVEHKQLLQEIYRAVNGGDSITWAVPNGGGTRYYVTMHLTGDEGRDWETLWGYTSHELYSLMCDPRIGMASVAEGLFVS